MQIGFRPFIYPQAKNVKASEIPKEKKETTVENNGQIYTKDNGTIDIEYESGRRQ